MRMRFNFKGSGRPQAAFAFLLRCSTFAFNGGTIDSMSAESKEVFIQGRTKDGQTFRPSDWAERLAGAMSCFHPGGTKGGISSFIGYSPYCVPRVIDGIKCVIVNEKLRNLEPMAWDFVMNFARDNNLQVADASLMSGQVSSVVTAEPVHPTISSDAIVAAATASGSSITAAPAAGAGPAESQT